MKPHPTPEALAQRRGIAVVTGAFFIWGLFPLYFKPLAGVPALELVSHRIVWCAVFVVAWLLWRRELPEVVTVLRDWRKARWLAASAVLICVNWLVYVWAVTHGRVVEVSLGYFINPLFNVALGIAVFRERLSRPQWLAVSLAVAGVLYLSIASGRAVTMPLATSSASTCHAPAPSDAVPLIANHSSHPAASGATSRVSTARPMTAPTGAALRTSP